MIFLRIRLLYTSARIEKSIIGINISHTSSKDGSHSYSCNYEDRGFDFQLDQWVVDKLFQNLDELIIIELKLCIEDW